LFFLRSLALSWSQQPLQLYNILFDSSAGSDPVERQRHSLTENPQQIGVIDIAWFKYPHFKPNSSSSFSRNLLSSVSVYVSLSHTCFVLMRYTSPARLTKLRLLFFIPSLCTQSCLQGVSALEADSQRKISRKI
jgi:hypothetical protein